MLRNNILALVAIAAVCLAPAATAGEVQDAVIADPERYTVEFENDRVRIIRIKYGPGEKSVMHSHGPNVAVMLSDGPVRMHLEDGTHVDETQKVGMAVWDDAGNHLPENLSDGNLEVVLIELKD